VNPLIIQNSSLCDQTFNLIHVIHVRGWDVGLGRFLVFSPRRVDRMEMREFSTTRD